MHVLGTGIKRHSQPSSTLNHPRGRFDQPPQASNGATKAVAPLGGNFRSPFRGGNSASRDVYAGPSRRPLPRRGTMSMRTARRRDPRAKPIMAAFGSGSRSGFGGMLARRRLRKRASLSWYANSHASTARTATRKQSWGATDGSHLLRNVEEAEGVEKTGFSRGVGADQEHPVAEFDVDGLEVLPVLQAQLAEFEASSLTREEWTWRQASSSRHHHDHRVQKPGPPSRAWPAPRPQRPCSGASTGTGR